MANDQHDFEQFMELRAKAAQAYVSGEAGPVDQIATRDNPATFFPPSGGHLRGATEVAQRYVKDAAMFAAGSQSELEILHMHASGGLAYWVGFQHAKVSFPGRAELVPFHLRITELFRREGNEWKMIHRHADALSEPQKK
jgi:ketosteroid isomerase-like protein